MKKLIAAIAICACPIAVWADGLESLELFIRATASGRAEFNQTVTSPPRDGQAARTRNSSGTFEFVRPSRFRFNYRKPFEQVIVADGQTLWLYDADLNQVTVRAQSNALSSTPAALIASAPNLQALQAEFTLANAPERDGLQWVMATPRNRDSQLQSVRVGLRTGDKNGAQTAELAALEITDGFGQRSVLKFSNVQVNPAIPAETFRFKPPQGADVIRQ